MKENRIHQKFENLNNALTKLHDVLEMPIDKDRIVLDAAIQRFEFNYELFWKILKILLEEQGIQATTPKEVFKEAYAAEWLTNEKIWLDMIRDRNTTSHVYNEKIALEIHSHLKVYYPEMKKVFDFLKNKFS